MARFACVCVSALAKGVRVSCRILSWGGKQDGSRMIVACETCAYLLGGSGGMPPQENLHPLRLLLMQSGTKFPNILMTHAYVQ